MQSGAACSSAFPRGVRRSGRTFGGLAVGFCVLLVGACTTTRPGSSSAEVTASSETSTTAAPTTTPGIGVVAEPDSEQTAKIGPAGGSISIVAADGTKYDLEVPPFALAQETKIVATAAHLSGLSAPTSAVLFQPSGLFLFKDARLTIVGTQPLPVEQQYMFVMSDDASAFALSAERCISLR